MGHIFISYSKKDVVHAEKLINALKREGFNPWVDIEGLGAGTHWRSRLESQIETSDAYILIVSRNSAKSKWVKEELLVAQGLGKPIFPLRIDNTKPFFGIRTIQYEDIRRGKLPSEEFYERLAAKTSRKKKKRRGNRTDKAKKQVMEGTAELLSYFGEELSNKGKDFIAVASKKSSEAYKSVINSDAVKRLSASVKKNITPEEKTDTLKKKKRAAPKKKVAISKKKKNTRKKSTNQKKEK